MRNSKFAAILIVLLIGCNKDVDNLEQEITVQKIKVTDDQLLLSLLDEYIGSVPSGRTMSSPNGNIDLESAIKVDNPQKNTIRYSLLLKDENNRFGFSNYIIREKDGLVSRYILDYIPDLGWLLRNPTPNWSKFTGMLTAYTLDGRIISENYLVDGIGQTNATPNGREECEGGGSNCTFSTREIPDHTSANGYRTIVEVNCGGIIFDIYSANTCGDTGGFGDPTTGGNGSGESSGDGQDGAGGGVGPAEEFGYEDDPDPIGMLPEPVDNLSELAIQYKIEQDEFALISNCDQIENWRNLAQNTPSNDIINKLSIVADNINGTVNVQNIRDASGAVVNMDYFPVTVTRLPNDPDSGEPFSADEFLEHIRLNINDFIDTDLSEFSPSTITGFDETYRWESNDPTGAILHINIPTAGDGSVICTDHFNDFWIFATIEVPWRPFTGFDGVHPVSGNREFGYVTNSDGSYTFYTRGVDRITTALDANTVDVFFSNPFSDPDNLWNSFKEGIHNFTQTNGGNSNPPSDSENVIERPDWEDIRDVLNGTKSIAELGCD